MASCNDETCVKELEPESLRGARSLNSKGKISPGCSTVVLICITCPAITVVTVILWALDRVRGRALGWLGPGSPKSQSVVPSFRKLATARCDQARFYNDDYT